jgi:hypothetical protein
MPDIFKIKNTEMVEVIDFYYFIEEYGHIFYDDPSILDEHFKKILEGMESIRDIVDDNYGK